MVRAWDFRFYHSASLILDEQLPHKLTWHWNEERNLCFGTWQWSLSRNAHRIWKNNSTSKKLLNKRLRPDLLFLISSIELWVCDTFCTIIVLTTCKNLTFLPMSSSSSTVEFVLLFGESTDDLLCLCPLSRKWITCREDKNPIFKNIICFGR